MVASCIHIAKPHMSKRAVGFLAGIVSGIAYGTNPLFGVPLLTTQGMSVGSVLFYRYFFAMLFLGTWLFLRRVDIRVSRKQLPVLILLGVLFAMSSFFLFRAYHFVPSGIATTIVFLYPMIVALLMMIFRVFPTWQVWLSIAMTFIGVLFLCHTDAGSSYQPIGYLLAAGSAASYAVFIVIINRSRRVRSVSNSVLTFYSLVTAAVMFLINALWTDSFVLPTLGSVGDMFGLAIFPTIVSTATLACATRCIGATQASVLGVFEPMTAIAIGVIIMHEPINASIIIGLVITIAAVIFMTISENNRKSMSA